MHQLTNIAAMFAITVVIIGIIGALWFAFDRWAFPTVEFKDEIAKTPWGWTAVLCTLIFSMFFFASHVFGAQITSRYDDAFHQQARLQFGFLYPWQVFKAQGMTESNLTADACSQVGACGVMQFMPGTAVGMGLVDRFDAKESIRVGIKYDRALWKQWSAPRPPGDQLDFAFASYNAGLGYVIGFQQAAVRAGAVNASLWPQVAPFAWPEPRQYVERIHRWQARFALDG